MNVFQRIFGAPEKRALSSVPADPELLRIFGAVSTFPGIVVNAETALRSPTALAAIKAISETAGMLPIAVRRREGSGWTKVTDHPASALLNGFSNEWTSSEQLRTQIAVDALTHRNGGFAHVVRVNGEPRELHRIHPGAVVVKLNQATGEPSYEVSLARGGTRTLSWRDVVHLMAPGSTFERSMCPVELARGAIAIDLLLADHERRVFEGGGLPRLFLSPESPDISPDALAKAMAFVAKQMGKNIGEPVMLPTAFKDAIKSFGLADMQFLELRRFATEEIGRSFRTPATIVGDLTKGTFANTEQMGRQFLQLCLLPWLEQFESAFTRALIPADERATVELEHITEDLLRGDTAARSNAYRQAAGGAWLTRNEVRELEGRTPLPEGDTLLNQAGQTDAGNKPKDPPEDA